MNKSIILAVLFLLIVSVAEAAVVDNRINEELSEKGYAKVLIKFKDDFKQPKGVLSVSDKKIMLTQRADSIKQTQEAFLSKEKNFVLSKRFSQINGLSGKIDLKLLEKIKNNPNIEAIQFDNPVGISLDQSVPQINALEGWKIQLGGINMTGIGETICIVDTGINYQHPALGECSIVSSSYSGINESYVLESAHPYADNQLYTWTITKQGYSNIALHFKNISIESGYDQLKIYDCNNDEIASYSGMHTDLWTPSAECDTLYIKWQTDVNTNDYGFYIDYVLNGTTSTTYDWSSCSKVIGGWDYVNSDPDPMDDHSHGTHCAGIAASNASVYRGVAPDAKLIAIKVLDSGGGGTDSDVAAGIDWCINRSADYNISVISLSLGCVGSCTHWQSTCDSSDEVYFTASPINTANSLGIAVTIASGNSGWTDGIASPACVSGAIPVGAVDSGDSIVYNRGTLLNLLAPGVSITAPILGTSYGDKSGTSMSTPHVAGAAALLKQFQKLWNNTVISPAEIKAALNYSGKQIYDSGSGKYYSRINIYDSFLYLDNAAPVVDYASNNPEDNISTSNITIVINATVSDNISVDSCILEWNGINESISKIGSGVYVYCSAEKNLSTGVNEYKIYANDSSNNFGVSLLRYINYNHAPNITSYYPVSSDFLISEPSSQYFNATVFDLENNSIVYNWYLNGTSVSNESSYNFTGSYTSAGAYNITLIVSDWADYSYFTWIMTVNNTNSAPVITSAVIVSSDLLNRTNGTLIASFTYTEPDNEPVTNETKWFNNSVEVSAYANLTFVPANTARKGQTWVFSVRVNDNCNWSEWHNASIVINNAAPELYLINSITVNESQMVNITAVATDIDYDSLNYEINDSRFSKNGNQFIWLTNLSDSGVYSFKINVSDGSSSDYDIFSVTVNDAPDFDNDGNPDFNDTDDDNDGITDSADMLLGNVSNINASGIKLYVNNSPNTSKAFSELLIINITDNSNNNLVKFQWNFSKSRLIVNWTLEYNASAGTARIYGLEMQSGILKTIFINKSSSADNSVCIADDENTPVSQLSSTCSGYTRISCNGTSGNYNCTDLGNLFKIDGLSHSAVKTINYVSSISVSSGGGSSSKKCTESWSCSEWTQCINGIQMRNCVDLNVCGTNAAKPELQQVCGLAEEITPEKTQAGILEEELKSAEEEVIEHEESDEPKDFGEYLSGKMTLPVIILGIILLVGSGMIYWISIKV